MTLPLVYGLLSDGSAVHSVTVLQKQPYALTPPRYAAMVAAGGNPSAQYAAESFNMTFKNADGLPDVPGNPPTPAEASGSSQPYPGPTDPVVAPAQPNDASPCSGDHAPGASELLPLPDGHGGTYTVSQLYSFGDRLSDTGNTAALETSLGQQTPLTSPPFSADGSFSDGPNWTTILGQALGVQPSEAQTNFAYESATARPIPNPLDPNQNQTTLSNFPGQIEQFEQGASCSRLTISSRLALATMTSSCRAPCRPMWASNSASMRSWAVCSSSPTSARSTFWSPTCGS